MTDLGTFKSKNHPSASEILSQTRAENWRDATAFLAVCCIQAFAWLAWADKF